MYIKIIKIILIVIMIVSLFSIFIWVFENNNTKEIVVHAKKYINNGNRITLNSEIKTINEDIIGWLIVDNTKIDYPIVQTAKKLKCKYIAEAWDLWPEDFVTFGMVKSNSIPIKIA